MSEKFISRFIEIFGFAPTHLVHAPGRVNLIGEHTDYNGGYVLPMAIDMTVSMAILPREDDIVCVFSSDFDEKKEFSIGSLAKKRGWLEYLKGVTNELRLDGYKLNGFDALLWSELPMGAGLSSSAALEVATVLCFSVSSKLNIPQPEIAKIAQRAENNWIGMRCGIMDQMASTCGKKNHALLIDCMSLETELLKLPKGAVIAILDTGTRHELASSAYNDRRASCEKACKFFGVSLLRHISPERFKTQGANLAQSDDETFRRAKHIIAENARTLEAAEALRYGDAKEFGLLMNESHYSLRDDYEVSCDELDIMSDLARRHAACFGARMTGGGFGGSVVALVAENMAEQFAHDVLGAYISETESARIHIKNEPQAYLCRAEDGGKIEEVV